MTLELKATHFLSPGYPLAIINVPGQPNYPLHGHDFTELVVVRHGTALHEVGGHAFPLRRGDVLVIPLGQPHGYNEVRELGLTNIMFRAAELPLPHALFDRLPGYHALFNAEPLWRRQGHFHDHLHLEENRLILLLGLVDQLTQELRAAAPVREIMGTALLTQILVQLARWYQPHSAPQTRPPHLQGQLHAYLVAHLDQPLTLEYLAKQLHISPRTLQRHCRQLLGRTPLQYLTELRIAKACQLLQETDLPVATVGQKVGLPEANYFARTFRQYRGVSPREYRHRLPG